MTPEAIRSGLEIAAILGGWGIAVLLVTWRLSKHFHKNDERMERMARAIAKLAAAQGRAQEAQEKAGLAFVALKTKLEEREKDITRLEGVSDATRKDLMETVKALQAAKAAVDAMWLTLQRLFPDKVPARAVDKAR